MHGYEGNWQAQQCSQLPHFVEWRGCLIHVTDNWPASELQQVTVIDFITYVHLCSSPERPQNYNTRSCTNWSKHCPNLLNVSKLKGVAAGVLSMTTFYKGRLVSSTRISKSTHTGLCESSWKRHFWAHTCLKFYNKTCNLFECLVDMSWSTHWSWWHGWYVMEGPVSLLAATYTWYCTWGARLRCVARCSHVTMYQECCGSDEIGPQGALLQSIAR